jgi:16S rRNA (adenine1518-N6/adenine1519-N6)-dimethyltransferase
MKAKKSLGQHFLKSERALEAIIEAGKIKEGETILEIGPGTGALTERLLAVGAKVIAVEKDDNLFELLKEIFKEKIDSAQLTLVHEDILEFEIENSMLEIGDYKLIANIPYNITGAILEKFLQNPPTGGQPSQMVLLVQKEVAKRIAASDGKESILSISVKAYGKPRYVETVKAGSFAPAPKVDSAIISIENISKSYFDDFSEELFFKLVKSGFQSKRKKLSSNLSQVIDKGKVAETFAKLHLSENIRAENVSIEAWKEIVSALNS